MADRVATKPGMALALHNSIWSLKADEVGASVDLLYALEQLRSRLVTVALTSIAGPGAPACAPSLPPEGRVVFVHEPPRDDWSLEMVYTCSLTHPVTGDILTAEFRWPNPQEGLTFRTATFYNADRAGGERCYVFAFNRQDFMDMPE
jgi:hypothetical protein